MSHWNMDIRQPYESATQKWGIWQTLNMQSSTEKIGAVVVSEITSDATANGMTRDDINILCGEVNIDNRRDAIKKTDLKRSKLFLVSTAWSQINQSDNLSIVGQKFMSSTATKNFIQSVHRPQSLNSLL